MLNKIVNFFKQIKSDLMDGYNDGRTRSLMGWSYNLKQYRRKRK